MIITLTSDFGTKDNSVAIAKGLFLKHLPHVQLIDISHQVLPYNLNHCYYILQSGYRQFPKDTIHVSLFNIMHRKGIGTLICQHDGQYLISTDNGLLPSVFEKEINTDYYNVPVLADGYYSWIENCARFIADNQSDLLAALQKTEPEEGAKIIKPVFYDNIIECSVMHIDHYDNIVLNLTQEEFEQKSAGRAFKISYLRDHLVEKITEDYNQSNGKGDLICRFNNAGYMELAIYEGKASRLISIESYYTERLISSKVKIEFL